MPTQESPGGTAPAQETPEQRLERMLVAYEAAINADAGRNLREIIAADGGLRRNVLKAIGENDLNAIAVPPATGAGIDGYDVASRTLYLPPTALQAAAATDRDARRDAVELFKDRVRTASLSPEDRLDRLLDRFEDAVFDRNAVPRPPTTRIDNHIDSYNAQLTAMYDAAKPPRRAGERPLMEKNDDTRSWYAGEVREHLKDVLTSSPQMKATVLARVESGQVTSFGVVAENTGAGGSYAPASGTMHFVPENLFAAGDRTLPLAGRQSLPAPRADIAFYETVGTAGHEFDHSARQARSRQASADFLTDANAVLQGPGPHDYTASLQKFVGFQRENEARSHLEHFNGVVRALGGNPSERQIYDASPGRMKMFFNVEEGPADDRSYPRVSLKSEHLQYHPPGSKLLSQDLPKNVDGMAALYFDQPPHLMKLGSREDLDYRHSLAYPNIVAILEAETKLAARDGKPTEVRLDLKALGLDHDRLRPYLTFADGQPRTYVDISDPAHPRTLRTDQPAPPAPAVVPPVGPGTPPGISPSAPNTPANAPATTGIPVAPAESPPSAPSPPQTVPSAPGMPAAVPASLTGTPAALVDSPADRTTAPVLPMPALGAKDRAVFEDVAEIARMRGLGEAGGRNAAMAMVASLHETPLVRSVDRLVATDGRDGTVTVFASHHPYGDREPIHHAHIDLARAAQEPLEDSLKRMEQADARVRELGQVQTQAQESAGPSTEHGGPGTRVR